MLECLKFLSHFKINLNFLNRSSHKSPVSNFTEILPVGTALICAYRRIEMTELIGTLSDHANVRKITHSPKVFCSYLAQSLYFVWNFLSAWLCYMYMTTHPQADLFIIRDCSESRASSFVHFIKHPTNSTIQIMKHDWGLWTGTFMDCMMDKQTNTSDVWLTVHRNSVWIKKTN